MMLRNFATQMVTSEAKEEDQTEKLSNAFKNQHIRYVPPKKFIFNVATNEGRMCQVFEAPPVGLRNRADMWKPVSFLALSIVSSAYMLLPAAQALMIYPAVFVPTLYTFVKSYQINCLFKSEVEKMWLM